MKNLFLIFLVLSCLSSTYAQIGIKANNTAPITSAQLEVQSTTKAFYPPRMTTAQKNAIAGVAAGAMVFDTDLVGLFTYNGSSWVSGSGLTLPYSYSGNLASGNLISVENTNTSNTNATINAKTNAASGATAIYALASHTNPGFAHNSAIHGVNLSTSTYGYGIYGSTNGTGSGVRGESYNGTGVSGYSPNGTGISGYGLIGGDFISNDPTGKALQTSGGVRLGGNGVGTLGANKFLKSINSFGDAQWSDLVPYNYSGSLASGSLINVENTNTTSSHTILGATNSGYDIGAVYGVTYNTNPSLNPSGLRGRCLSSNYNGFGVFGEHTGFGTAVYGTSDNGYGVKGESLLNYGVHGRGGSIGVWGHSPSTQGVQGSSISGIGGLFTSSTGFALVTNTGKVGLGTITPSLNTDERVDINGRLRIRNSASSAGVWFNNSTNSLSFADGAFWGMKLDTESGVYISNAWRFWVNNLGNATLTGTLTQSSDRRLKKDFSSLTHSLSDVYQLNGYHYKWIEESRSKDLQTGLIAQEVQKIFPELVQTDEKGFLSVNYIGLIPHLIEAVKELRNENAGLKGLKDENKDLRNRLEKIEALLSVSTQNSIK